MPVVREDQEGVLLELPGGSRVFQTMPLPGGLSPEAWVKRMASSMRLGEGARWTIATAQRTTGGYTPKKRWRKVPRP